MVGAMADRVLAARVGCTHARVRERRMALGLPPWRLHRRADPPPAIMALSQEDLSAMEARSRQVSGVVARERERRRRAAERGRMTEAARMRLDMARDMSDEALARPIGEIVLPALLIREERKRRGIVCRQGPHKTRAGILKRAAVAAMLAAGANLSEAGAVLGLTRERARQMSVDIGEALGDAARLNASVLARLRSPGSATPA